MFTKNNNDMNTRHLALVFFNEDGDEISVFLLSDIFRVRERLLSMFGDIYDNTVFLPEKFVQDVEASINTTRKKRQPLPDTSAFDEGYAFDIAVGEDEQEAYVETISVSLIPTY